MRGNVEDSAAFNQLLQSGRFSHSRKVLSADVGITLKGDLVNFFDAGGSNRNVTLPELEEGRFYFISNVGTTNNLVIKYSTGTTITTLLPGDTGLLIASGFEWTALRGWAALAVFTNTVNGLVPAPNSAVPGSLFLRDDGQWGQVQVTGIVDAFKFITDGTNTAIGSGPDTFRIRSSTSKIGVTVTNNEAVFGDNVNLTVLEAAVDHNSLLNFVADKHIAHTSVTLTAGNGLSGGGDIAASRTFDLDLSDLVSATPVLTDTFGFYSVSGLATNKTTFSVLNGIIDHNALLNYSANRHIDHSAVSIVASTGLSGGGDITTSRSLALDINGLTVDTLAVGDFLPFYDISGGDINKVTIANLNATLDHNSLLNYVADQHVAHSGVTLTAGAGLTGGGTIAASRTFDVGAGTGILSNANDVALDTTSVYNVDHSAVSITGTGALTGGGTIAASRTLDVATNGVTYAKFQQVAAVSLVGNATGSLANAAGITLGATLTFSGSALQTLAISGDISSAANSFVTTIAAGAVSNSKMANMAAHTLKANITAGAAAPADSSLTAILDAELGSTRGQIIVRGVSSWGVLAVGTNTQVLTSNGTDPGWAAPTGGSGAGGEPFALHAGIGGL